MQKPADRASSRPLGVLILGRKRPGFDQEWNSLIRHRALTTLADLGHQIVGGDVALVEDATVAAEIERLKQADCQALVILQPSFAHGQLALTVAQHWPDPVVLWATPERLGDGKASSNSLVGQHLWASVLRQAGHPFEVVYGDPEEETLRFELTRAIALARTTTQLRSCRVGLVGGHAPGFINLTSDPSLLRRTMGAQLEPLSLPQFMERVRSIEQTAADKDVQQVLDMKFPMDGITPHDLETNSRYYLAILSLMQDENLDALALQCWPDLPNLLGQWPYLAVARLGGEGYAVCVEGDVDGCVGNLMSLYLGLGPSFLTDWLEHDYSTVHFWHPGMAPLSMCEPIGADGGPTLANHFNLARPCVVNARLRCDEPATVARLWRCDGKYHLTAFEGRTIPPKRRITGSTELIQTTEPDIPKRFDTLLHAGMPHHVLISFGHNAEVIRRLARILHIEWHS